MFTCWQGAQQRSQPLTPVDRNGLIARPWLVLTPHSCLELGPLHFAELLLRGPLVRATGRGQCRSLRMPSGRASAPTPIDEARGRVANPLSAPQFRRFSSTTRGPLAGAKPLAAAVEDGRRPVTRNRRAAQREIAITRLGLSSDE